MRYELMAAALLSLAAAPVLSQTYTQDFEHVSNAWFHSPLMGASQEGSVADVSKARAHTGSQSGHLAYKFSKRGNVSLTTDEYPVVLQEGDKLHLSVWIYGCGQNDFLNGGGITLVDAGNETFLYWLGKPLADALDGSEWKRLTADIDVSKPAGHWGGKNTGVIKMPLRFLGFGLDHSPDVAAQGEIFVDDLVLTGQSPSAAAAAPNGETKIAAFTPSSAKMTDPDKSLPLLFAVCTHLHGLGPADAEREVQWIRAIGFRACRFDFSWGAIEPEQGIWKWELYDRIIALMKKYDIEPLPVLSYSTKWAATGNRNSKEWHDWANSPPDTQAFSTFARESARRYGSSVRYWEVWNEPDNGFWRGTPAQYAQLFDATYSAIKGVEPGAVVLNGGISEIRRPPDFVPNWTKAAREKPDVFAYHSHAVFSGMLRASDFIRTDLKAAKWTMPVWNNEAGFSSSGSNTEQDQAIILAKKMSYAPALGDKAYFWYDLRNDPPDDPNDSERNFGLLHSNFSPKPSAIAARTLIDTLSGNRFIRQIAVKDDPGIVALLFGATDSRSGVVSLWTEGRGSVPLLWSMPGKTSRTSIAGSVDPLRSSPGLVSLSASPEPQFISFAGNPDELKPVISPLGLPAQIIVAPGDIERVRILVTNSLGRPMSAKLTLSAPSGWRVAPSTFPVELAVGARKELHVDLTAPAHPALCGNLNVRLSSSVLPSDLSASVVLSGAVVIPRMSADPAPLGDASSWTQPTVSLGRANLVSLYQNAPLDNMLFHGDDDLSACVYVSRVLSGLRLSVRVRDDVHCQDEPSGAEWLGDSIQFAIALPSGENYGWTAALTAKRGPVANIEIAPLGVALGAAKFPLAIRRAEASHETLYDLIVPNTLPGGSKLPDRFSMTLLVNDNDGAGRKGWVEWTPGIGRSKDPSQFQPIVVR